MAMQAEITRLRQEAELLRAVTVEKGILHQRIEEAAWERIARVMNVPDTTCKQVHAPAVNLQELIVSTDPGGEPRTIAWGRWKEFCTRHYNGRRDRTQVTALSEPGRNLRTIGQQLQYASEDASGRLDQTREIPILPSSLSPTKSKWILRR
jgi:hypothetical protein